jgi:hypothetical protein
MRNSYVHFFLLLIRLERISPKPSNVITDRRDNDCISEFSTDKIAAAILSCRDLTEVEWDDVFNGKENEPQSLDHGESPITELGNPRDELANVLGVMDCKKDRREV